MRGCRFFTDASHFTRKSLKPQQQQQQQQRLSLRKRTTISSSSQCHARIGTSSYKNKRHNPSFHRREVVSSTSLFSTQPVPDENVNDIDAYTHNQVRDPKSTSIPTANNGEKSESNHFCDQVYAQVSNSPLPPPLPEPEYSFHRRILPSSLIQLSSPEGKALFKESLLSESAEAFFPLSEQFLNQSDPAYCGVTTLVMILNAFGIDPNVRWKGGWRWYGSEDMILDACCVNPERVRRGGISMEEYQSLGRCQGLQVKMKRPIPIGIEHENDNNGDDNNENYESKSEKFYTIDDFREDIKSMVQNPPIFETNNEGLAPYPSSQLSPSGDVNGFIIVSFSRETLGQTGSGHFSPIAAYHEATDRCLILDVARFKYGPYWVTVPDLYEATKPEDTMTDKSRGWFLNYPPKSSIWNSNEGGKEIGYKGSKTTDEVKRPAAAVSFKQACPVGKIKVQYCSVGKNESNILSPKMEI
jgi:glutathione gamma-glutamylcysteinyltransferase